jgi:hypothetical protein
MEKEETGGNGGVSDGGGPFGVSFCGMGIGKRDYFAEVK